MPWPPPTSCSRNRVWCSSHALWLSRSSILAFSFLGPPPPWACPFPSDACALLGDYSQPIPFPSSRYPCSRLITKWFLSVVLFVFAGPSDYWPVLSRRSCIFLPIQRCIFEFLQNFDWLLECILTPRCFGPFSGARIPDAWQLRLLPIARLALCREIAAAHAVWGLLDLAKASSGRRRWQAHLQTCKAMADSASHLRMNSCSLRSTVNSAVFTPEKADQTLASILVARSRLWAERICSQWLESSSGACSTVCIRSDLTAWCTNGSTWLSSLWAYWYKAC